MDHSRYRKQFALYVLAAAALALALYFLHAFTPTLNGYLAGGRARFSLPVDILKVTGVILGASLAAVLVSAVGKAIFGVAFRLRKGYEAPALVRNTFSIIAYVIIFVIAFKELYPEVELGALFTTSAIFGVIIGLALQDTLGNLFAGISLHADKPFQVGDVITVGQWTGTVDQITWRGVKIRTFQNHFVLASNSSVAKESIEVCPRENLNARLVFFNTLYTDSPAKTFRVVREAMREAGNVSQQMPPVVRIKNLGESGVDYEVKYWLEDYARYNDTDALVRERIWYAFRRAGIQFAFPTRTLHIARRAKADGAVEASKNGFADRLAAVNIFAPLSAEEISSLACASVSHVFAPGEIIIRKGERGSSMFVIHRGRVQVQVTDNNQPCTIAVLQEGNFFGEMALFTGEPRTADVVAADETEVLEIKHQAMKHLFEINPDLVESFSHTVAERRRGLPPEQEVPGKDPGGSEGLIAAIKRFFGIESAR